MEDPNSRGLHFRHYSKDEIDQKATPKPQKDQKPQKKLPGKPEPVWRHFEETKEPWLESIKFDSALIGNFSFLNR